MKRHWMKWMCMSLLAFGLAACSLVNGQPTVDSASIGTIVALDVQLTQVGATLTSVVANQSATPVATPTPAATTTPTPEPSITPTLSGVWLTIPQNTNCRQGPSTSWPVVVTLQQGQSFQAVGRSTDGQFIYIRVIDTAVRYCWVYGQAVVVSAGGTDRLGVLTAQPTSTPSITPTPAAGFTVSYDSKTSCSSAYAINLMIKNTGYLTWQSIKIVIADATTGTTVTHTSDDFTAYSGCSVSQSQHDLSTYEYGVVSSYDPGQFTYDPTGHALTVTVTLYSENGLSGTVITQVLPVTP